MLYYNTQQNFKMGKQSRNKISKSERFRKSNAESAAGRQRRAMSKLRPPPGRKRVSNLDERQSLTPRSARVPPNSLHLRTVIHTCVLCMRRSFVIHISILSPQSYKLVTL